MSTPAPVTGPLDLETVLAQAAALVEEQGVEALTMRRLAARCGVTAMSLYRHVRTKEELLVAIANQQMETLELPARDRPWREQVAAVFRSLHRMWIEHPHIAQITATNPVEGVAALQGMEIILSALRSAGLDAEQAVTAYDALASYTAGFNQQHFGRKAHAVSPGERLSRLRGPRAAEFPHVVELAGRLITRDPESQFDKGLDVVLDGIAAMASRQERSA